MLGTRTNPQYRAISYFDAVRRCGSIREAARRLNVAASAINRQILKFEAELGMPLFERLSDGLRLTPAGEIFARHVIAVLQDERRTAGELDALRGLHRGEIAIVAVESLNTAFLPDLIARMAERFPGVDIKVRSAGSKAIPGAIAGDEADIGLAFSLQDQPDLQKMAAGKLRLGAVTRPDHPLARETQITFPTCARHALILPSEELSIHASLLPLLRRFAGKLEVAAEVSSMELMKRLTLRLGAISFQTRLGIEAELDSGQLVFRPLPGPITTELGIYLRRGRSIPAAVEAFIGLAEEPLAALE